jgi:hypothetical protein
MQASEASTGEINSLKEELEELRREVNVIKRAVRNKIARYEIGLIRRGKEVKSILDLRDLN